MLGSTCRPEGSSCFLLAAWLASLLVYSSALHIKWKHWKQWMRASTFIQGFPECLQYSSGQEILQCSGISPNSMLSAAIRIQRELVSAFHSALMFSPPTVSPNDISTHTFSFCDHETLELFDSQIFLVPVCLVHEFFIHSWREVD